MWLFARPSISAFILGHFGWAEIAFVANALRGSRASPVALRRNEKGRAFAQASYFESPGCQLDHDPGMDAGGRWVTPWDLGFVHQNAASFFRKAISFRLSWFAFPLASWIQPPDVRTARLKSIQFCDVCLMSSNQRVPACTRGTIIIPICWSLFSGRTKWSR